MKAMLIDRFGGPEEFRVADVPLPIPGPEDVLIKEAFASVNPADWKGRAGLLPNIHGLPFPMITGMDCSGIVEQVGEGVTKFAPGDRVITLSGFGRGQSGTYAEYCAAPWRRVELLPSHLSFAEGATIPIAGASAASSILDVAKVGPGDVVFLNGGAGSVGTFAVQFIRYLGAKVAATCSTRNVEYVRSLGADLVIDYTRENIMSALAAWSPDGLSSVIDAVGQRSLPREIPNAIRPGGVLVCIRNLLTGVEAFDLDAASARNVRVVDNIAELRPPHPAEFQVAAFRRLLEAIEAGAVKTPPFEVVPLEDVGEAQRRVEDGHVRGKILLKIADL